MNEHWRRGSLIWPLIFIAVGIILLLNNIGYLNWDVWFLILRLWPLILIAIGLDILIGRRSLIGSIVVVLVVALLFGGALYYFGILGQTVGEPPTNQTINQQLQDATSGNVTISSGVSTLRLRRLDDAPAVLIRGTVATGNGENVTRQFNLSGSTAEYELKSEGPSFSPFVGAPSRNEVWDLQLTPAVPLDLRVNMGLSDANLDLTGLNLSSLDLSAGVGQANVTLPAHGRFQANVNGGVGNLTVRIPLELGARIHISNGLGPVNVAPRYQRQGDTYTSQNYDSVNDRVDLNLSGGIGQVSVQASNQD